MQRAPFPFSLLAPVVLPTPAPGVQWPQPSFLKALGVCALPGPGVEHPLHFSPVGKSAERPIVLIVPQFLENPPKPPQKLEDAYPLLLFFWGWGPRSPKPLPEKRAEFPLVLRVKSRPGEGDFQGQGSAVAPTLMLEGLEPLHCPGAGVEDPLHFCRVGKSAQRPMVLLVPQFLEIPLKPTPKL